MTIKKPLVLGDVKFLNPKEKYVTSINLLEREHDMMKTAMKKHNYGSHEQSKWIYEAIERLIGLPDNDFYFIVDTDVTPVLNEHKPKSSPIVVRFPGEAKDVLQDQVKRLESKVGEVHGMQTRIIRSAIMFRILMGF